MYRLRKILQSQQYLRLVPTNKRKRLSKNVREFTWLLNVTFFQGLSFVACESQLQIKKMEIKTVKIVKNYRYKSLSVGS